MPRKRRTRPMHNNYGNSASFRNARRHTPYQRGLRNRRSATRDRFFGRGDVRNEPVHTNRIQYNVQPANIAPDSLQPLLNPPLLLGLQNPIFNIAIPIPIPIPNPTQQGHTPLLNPLTGVSYATANLQQLITPVLVYSDSLASMASNDYSLPQATLSQRMFIFPLTYSFMNYVDAASNYQYMMQFVPPIYVVPSYISPAVQATGGDDDAIGRLQSVTQNAATQDSTAYTDSEFPSAETSVAISSIQFPQIENASEFTPQFFSNTTTFGSTAVHPLNLEVEELPEFDQENHQQQGLTEEEISRIAALTITDLEMVQQIMCVICQSDFELHDNVRNLNCAHCFHTECIDRWLMENCTCPICRANVLEESDQKSVNHDHTTTSDCSPDGSLYSPE